MSRRWARWAAIAGSVVLVALLVPAPASAQAGGWEIQSFDAEIVVEPDGTLQVTETIQVSFAIASRGIFREIPFRVPVGDDQIRVYEFSQISVSTSPDAPDQLHRERSGDYLVWRIGDPDTRITGEHTYVISYRVGGALNRFDTHDELFWNATGDRWEVPIERASATVAAPEVTQVRCFAGATGQTDPCADATHDGQVAEFTSDLLPPGTQLDVVVAMPPGVVEVAPPVLQPADPVARFRSVVLPEVFQVDAVRVGAAGVVGLAGAVAVGALIRRGRDERAGTRTGVLPGGVEYRPPDGLRPAQLRTLLTERVDDTSLSATLVDLAVRGHLRIEEIERTGLARLSRRDWVIHQLPAPADGLQPYEQEVLQGLFARRTLGAGLAGRLAQTGWGTATAVAPSTGAASVRVSELRNGTFHPYYRRATKLLYTDVVQRGFFRYQPQHVRAAFSAIGTLVLIAGVVGIAAMFALSLSYGLVVAPLPIVGLLLVVFSRWAPRRTATGSAMNQRARGFREFVQTAETGRMEFAERERLFVEYLPYAMVFGCVDRWVKAFAQLGVAPTAAAGHWYVGHGLHDVNTMTSALSSLGSQVGGSMRHTASSGGSSGFSGGGSSGGGGGGGGGGRW